MRRLQQILCRASSKSPLVLVLRSCSCTRTSLSLGPTEKERNKRRQTFYKNIKHLTLKDTIISGNESTCEKSYLVNKGKLDESHRELLLLLKWKILTGLQLLLFSDEEDSRQS